MSVEKFKVSKCDGSEYLAYVVEQRDFIKKYPHNDAGSLYFCLSDDSNTSNVVYAVKKIVGYEDIFRKTCYSDVVIEKIGDDYIVLKNRYGFNSDKQVKILATPVYERT